MRSIAISDTAPRGDDAYYLYNGLDCCITHEVWSTLSGQAVSTAWATYEFARSIQAPALEMMLRGFRVDMIRRNQMITEFEAHRDRVQANFDALTTALYGSPLNARSPVQLQAFFYDFLRLRPRRHKGRVTTNREALESLAEDFLAEPFVRHILTIRDLTKRIGTLRTEVDPDRRMRTTYSVAGTETGRFASYQSALGTGTNFQNLTERLRRIFVADPGCKIAYIDKEQAESRATGLYAWAATGRDTYLRACESGDLHTTVAKMVWPNKTEEDIRNELFYRTFTYRDISKRLGHASNYGGAPPTLSRILKLPEDLVRSFQRAYFAAFPELVLWHSWVARQIYSTGTLTNAFGRVRQYLGRATDDSTIREAIAGGPQSHVADDLNTAMLTVWRMNIPHLQFLAQIHDALIFQYPEHLEPSIIPTILSAMTAPVSLTSQFGTRELSIPVDCQIGWNWGHSEVKVPAARRLHADGNPDGLIKWRGRDDRTRVEFVDRRFHGMEHLHG